MPGRGLVFAVGEQEQIASRRIGKLDHLVVGVGFGGFAASGVVSVARDKAELVGVSDRALGGIGELFDTAIGISSSEQSIQIVEGAGDRHCICVHVGDRAVEDIVSDG